MVVVLDASAFLRWIDDEPGCLRINEIIVTRLTQPDRVVISTLHLGEVLGVLLKRFGPQAVEELSDIVEALTIEVIPATLERAQRSALIRYRLRIPYVDSFAVELASDAPDHILITGDFDFKPAENEVNIEFLPTKQSSVS